MRTKTNSGSKNLLLALILLIGAISASALNFSGYLAPLGVTGEGSYFAVFNSTPPPVVARQFAEATVSTDKTDYQPGDIVQISGTGFWPGEMVTLQVVHVEVANAFQVDSTSTLNEYDHAGHEPWQVMVNADGTFISSWLVQEDSLNKTLLLTADQPATEGHPAIHAETTFTDAAIGTYDQCSNDAGEGYPNGDDGCRWINGNLNGNNSSYPEGDATVQRVWLTGFEPDSVHTITFQYGTTKNGKHAYDFLTHWNWSENWITLADRCQDITGCTTAPETAADMINDPNLRDDVELADAGLRQFVMRGGTFEGPTPVSTPEIEVGTYAGTSETLVTVTFRTAASGSMCETKREITTCGVAIWFGAHVSKTVDWLAADGTTGAGNISGSPYHVALYRIDSESVGQRDNQMQASAVSAQSLEVRKVLSPSTDTGRFNLYIDQGTATEYVQTNVGDGGTTGPQSVTEGNHTVSETGGTTPPTNLSNYTTTLSCETTASNGQVTTQNYGSVTTQTVNVPADGDVVCTFTNTLRTGAIQIIKETVGGIPAVTYDWAFTPVGFNDGNVINLQTTGANGTDSSDVFGGLLATGTYSVSETGIEPGWDLTNSYCTNGTPASIVVVPNETTVCTFVNTEDQNETRGRIIIDKVTDPSGDPQSFTFTPIGFNGGNTFPLTDTAAPFDSGLLVPNADGGGPYSVSETVPAGWDLTSATCDDGSLISNIVVVAGQTVTCTFYNQKDANIIVQKVTDPAGSTQTFEFDTSYGSNFFLSDGQSNDSGDLDPSNYSVAEVNVPAGWSNTSGTCTSSLGGSESPGSIGLTAGETVTCTFTNTYLPSVTIDKSGDTLSKIGDEVNYTITVTNTSAAGTGAPSLECDISDPLLGFNKTVTLAPGAQDVSNVGPFTIPGDASDPFVNTASVSCSYPGSETVVASDSDDHSINLFQPAISFDKSADTSLSKVGDVVNYTLTLNNTSSADSPDLVCSISDAMLGVDKQVSLASGAGDITNVAYTVQAGDPDPLVNTANVSCSPTGFPNILTASDSVSVNLFQPSITLDKSADTELSKVGDPVNYTVTLANTSSADSPDLSCTVTDSLIGQLGSAQLASGQSITFNYMYTVQAGDPDPLVNTADVSCGVTGFPNVLTASDSWSVNLFQPSIDLEKTGPAYSKAGDTAVYTINIENTSSADSPDLNLDTLTDTLAGDLEQAAIDAGCGTLASGASCSFSYNYVVKAADPDPLENTASVLYHPAGFPNNITDSDTYSTDLLHPAFDVSKVCKAEPILRAGPAVFTITFNNTGDADLHVVPDEGDPFDVAAGQSYSYDYSVNGPFTGNVSNTVNGTVTLDEAYGLDNSYTFSSSDTCDVNGLLIVQKTTIPGGSLQEFSINASGTGAIVGGGAGTITDAIDQIYEVAPGTYDVSETVPDGWAETGNTCDDVVVPAGGSNSCLITNTLLPKLIVKKIVITPQVGVTSEDFTMQINSTALDPNPTEFPGSETGVTTYFPPGGGSYNVTENADDADPTVDLGLYQTNYSDDCTGTLTAGETKTCTVTNVYRTGFVTSSSLCTFDVDPNLPGDQFRLIYTPDQSISLNKLNSSNPGQFFYNVLHYNDGSPGADSVTMNIPYPFVTHGATPVHVYGDVEITQNGQTCLIPSDTLAGYQYTFGLDDFGGSPTMGVTPYSVTVNDLPEGFSYINIHLDYGLKKTTGYSKADLNIVDFEDSNICTNDANQTLSGPDIYDCQAYTFTNGGTQTVYSINSFKRNPGVGVLNLQTNEDPVVGAMMELRNSNGQLMNARETDEDGWTFLSFKHTGKAAQYTVVWVGSGQQKTVTLKANGMAQVDFP